MRRGGLTVRIARNLRAFPRVQMRDVRSLPPDEVAIASILAVGLRALQTRSWRRAELHMRDRQVQIDKPSIAYWRDHSAGASRRRVTPMPRGSRPWTAAFTRSGARNASVKFSSAAGTSPIARQGA